LSQGDTLRTHLTITEAAKRLGIHRDTLLKWTQRGWVPAHRLPNGRLLIQADVIARLLGQEAGHA
jgi:excisionase family DNA binding protein